MKENCFHYFYILIEEALFKNVLHFFFIMKQIFSMIFVTQNKSLALFLIDETNFWHYLWFTKQIFGTNFNSQKQICCLTFDKETNFLHHFCSTKQIFSFIFNSRWNKFFPLFLIHKTNVWHYFWFTK